MTDPLPAPPVNQIRLSAEASPHAGCFLLLCTALFAGCSDSHSDDFVEFTELKQDIALAVPEGAAEPTTGTSEDVVTRDAAVDSVAVIPSVEPVTASPEEEVEEDIDMIPDAAVAVEAPTVDSAESDPQAIRLLIPRRQFRKEGRAIRATFDDIDLLKVLNMDPVPTNAADHFPDWLKQLNGAHVRIRGYMRPGFEAEDITQFLFVRDNGECCYGPLPKIYDMIAVELAEGESTDLIDGTPFDVEGTLRIDPHADEVELYALFFIDNGVIID